MSLLLELSPISVIDIQKIIKGLAKENIGVLITDHNVRETLKICDKSYVINSGRVLASGKSKDLIKNDVKRSIFGRLVQIMNKLNQTTTISQRKVLSQQTRQAIRLLQLNSYDLEREVDNLVLENPLLEKNEEIESNYDSATAVGSISTDSEEILKYHKKYDSLQESLTKQLDLTSLSDDEKIVNAIIIDCVNDNGYLTEDLKEIFIQANRSTEVSFQDIFYVLHTLQRFEPIGICALDLCDSLSIQLDSLYADSPYYKDAVNIIDYLKNIDVSVNSRFDTIITRLDNDSNYSHEALGLIRKLNPKPGLEVSKKLDSYQILPEVIIYKRDGKWVTELTKNRPLLKLNSEYVSLMRESKIKTDLDYLRKKLQ